MSSEVLEILRKGFGDKKVLVVGDLILDQTYEGTTNRISPEAPIPVVNVRSCQNGLGGAGNVASNLARLGCSVKLAALIGRDYEGRVLASLLDERGIGDLLVSSQERMTTKKSRIVSARQQMIRLDFENTTGLSPEEEKNLMGSLDSCPFEKIGSVVLSDYGKGVCTSSVCRWISEKCKEKGVPLFVDPKGTEWEKYRGATVVTPNLKELGAALGKELPNLDEAIEDGARCLMERLELGSVMVTRSERGFSLITTDLVLHEPARALEVFDVTGAGDTFVAVMSAFVSAGTTLEESARMANLAAGYVVGKVGTYAIDRDEMLGVVKGLRPDVPINKVTAPEKVCAVIEGWKNKGYRVVFTNGCFDILHAGHVHCLEKAKEFGEKLVVGLNSDHSVRLNKGNGRPVNKQENRAKVISALSAVDLVVVFDEKTPLSLIKVIRPDILVKGGDYREEDIVGAPEVVSWNGKVVTVPLINGLSTTAILNEMGIYGHANRGEVFE